MADLSDKAEHTIPLNKRKWSINVVFFCDDEEAFKLSTVDFDEAINCLRKAKKAIERK